MCDVYEKVETGYFLSAFHPVGGICLLLRGSGPVICTWTDKNILSVYQLLIV